MLIPTTCTETCDVQSKRKIRALLVRDACRRERPKRVCVCSNSVSATGTASTPAMTTLTSGYNQPTWPLTSSSGHSASLNRCVSLKEVKLGSHDPHAVIRSVYTKNFYYRSYPITRWEYSTPYRRVANDADVLIFAARRT